MAKGVEIEIFDAGIQEILKSNDIQSLCTKYGQKILDRVGSGNGYIMDTQIGKYRSKTRVTAKSGAARRSELKNNTLLKAMGSIKG
ncbi:MAG: hypothetical protein IJH05_03505 [Firmicutes bacterium]|nr:hypothetical protein [Bacillota bacterium]